MIFTPYRTRSAGIGLSKCRYCKNPAAIKAEPGFPQTLFPRLPNGAQHCSGGLVISGNYERSGKFAYD